jgi:5-oxoprolinase (ATP-hydrolysing) subunit B
MEMPVPPDLIIKAAGANALLIDAAKDGFSEDTQERVWALAAQLRDMPGISETVPGMNNLLVLYDPSALDHIALERALRLLWADPAIVPKAGKVVDIPVIYGGPGGEDLGLWAHHCGLSREEAVQRHARATYRVAALGAMPGFPYLSGLPPELAMDRRDVPRVAVAKGAVIIGGAQTGVMPTAAPSGWHVVGHADIALFDIERVPPALLAPGDRVRFSIAGLEDD